MTHALREQATTEITNPATGEVIATVPEHTKEDTQEAFERARLAQKRWAQTSFRQRRKIFLRFHNLVLDNREKLMDTIQDENGKSRLSALEELLDVALTSRHYGYKGAKLLKPRRRKPVVPLLTSTWEQRAPKGVVGMIAPFNYPLSLSVCDALAAIFAGNAVVLKPDSQTPLSALAGLELLERAGLPRDVFQVVPGRGSEVGQAIVEECDYLMFTGSTATGEKLAQQAAARLIDYSMELGGKNAMIVAHDADVKRTVDGAWIACFGNSGQLCISIERLYVHRDVADEFIPAFVSKVQGLRVGAGHDWDIDMGSLISVEHADAVERFVNDAVDKGATVLTGGRRLPELGEAFFAPTVLTDVPAEAELYRSEVFGPVVYIEVVDSDEEAIARANDTEYGLNASVWAHPKTGRRIAAQLETGTVNINEGYAPAWSAIDAPMGGWKKSGVGRRHGDGGLTKYTEQRNVTQTRLITLMDNVVPRPTWASTMATALKLGRDILR
ncbi:succinic semialdehyde dehydrogenase [Corynebacterium auris]|uniref:succinic semialdehyde dehydrogenase n=1 Tax=Corynebacterium auris TaxID=44750 RepID=UPI0025B3179C|nr:succinic semialdehyde dehydrogenase [Corynebacterium auris]WJY67286.1 Putative succinate-semialdehyde dehydrogenase [NADP(+)] 2 [Corynebacterium auris]